jgi:hypothetical protein
MVWGQHTRPSARMTSELLNKNIYETNLGMRWRRKFGDGIGAEGRGWKAVGMGLGMDGKKGDGPAKYRL